MITHGTCPVNAYIYIRLICSSRRMSANGVRICETRYASRGRILNHVWSFFRQKPVGPVRSISMRCGGIPFIRPESLHYVWQWRVGVVITGGSTDVCNIHVGDARRTKEAASHCASLQIARNIWRQCRGDRESPARRDKWVSLLPRNIKRDAAHSIRRKELMETSQLRV